MWNNLWDIYIKHFVLFYVIYFAQNFDKYFLKFCCVYYFTKYLALGGKGVQTWAKPSKPSKPIFGPKSQLSKLAKGIR